MPITPRVEMRYNFRNEGKVNNIILHYTIPAAPADPGQWADWVEQYVDAVLTVTRNCITAETSFTSVTGRYISDAQSFDAEAAGGTTVGVVPGDTCPAEIAAIIRKKGIGPSKRANGTIFFPCVPEGFTNGTFLTTDGKGTYAAWVNVVITLPIVLDTTFTPVVMSRKANTLFGMFGGQVQDALGGQRRRRPF